MNLKDFDARTFVGVVINDETKIASVFGNTYRLDGEEGNCIGDLKEVFQEVTGYLAGNDGEVIIDFLDPLPNPTGMNKHEKQLQSKYDDEHHEVIWEQTINLLKEIRPQTIKITIIHQDEVEANDELYFVSLGNLKKFILEEKRRRGL